MLGNLLRIGIFIKEDKERSMEYLEKKSLWVPGDTSLPKTQGKDTGNYSLCRKGRRYTEKETKTTKKEAKKELDKWLKKGKERGSGLSVSAGFGRKSGTNIMEHRKSGYIPAGKDTKKVFLKSRSVEVAAFLSLGEVTDMEC